jgi:hypothetical protein
VEVDRQEAERRGLRIEGDEGRPPADTPRGQAS